MMSGMMQRKCTLALAVVAGVFAALACSLPSSLPFISTPTPTLTATATATATATSTPTPTPTPTPSPAERLENAAQEYLYGDWDSALDIYREIATVAVDLGVREQANIGAAKCLLALERYDELFRLTEQIQSQAVDNETAAKALLLKAWAYEGVENDGATAETYRQVLEMGAQPLRGYILDWRGDALWELGEYEQASQAYQAALFTDPTSERVQIEIKLAGTLEDRADLEGAIGIYQSIYDATDEEYLKAFLDRVMGDALMRLGRSEEAYARYLDAVENYPQFSDSYLALVELVNAGYAVSELDRALVDYFAGQYSPALVAFNRFEGLSPGERVGELHYYRGLTLRALGEYDLAIQEWDRLIAEYPDDEFISDAWDEQVTTLWAYLDQYPEAVELSERFAQTFPDHPRSGVFLYDAGRIAERNGDLNRAAELFRRAATNYPDADVAFRSQFLAGIALYRLGQMNPAQTAFLAAVEIARSGSDRAAAQLWVGKTHQELGAHDAAQQAYRAATLEDPNGYYGLRARERLIGGAPFRSVGTPVFPTSDQLDVARVAAADFLKARFPLGEGESYEGLKASLYAEPTFQRADLFWTLGRFAEAKVEFEALRSDYAKDAHKSFLLMEEMLERGLFQPAIYTALDLIELSGYSSTTAFDAPVYFNYVRFGPYFGDLILGAAENKGLDGIFVLSLVRQESLFESFATSYAAAQGLMQIIPSTAAEIVAKEGWPPDFTAADLYRPVVSIRLGVRYLADQRDFFDGDLYAALAAYNAGPGNSLAWKQLSGDDQDMFLEVIRLSQPRDYIRVIYWAYSHYNRLYIQPE
jgi:soluble lytic murein transglycosylase